METFVQKPLTRFFRKTGVGLGHNRRAGPWRAGVRRRGASGMVAVRMGEEYMVRRMGGKRIGVAPFCSFSFVYTLFVRFRVRTEVAVNCIISRFSSIRVTLVKRPARQQNRSVAVEGLTHAPPVTRVNKG